MRRIWIAGSAAVLIMLVTMSACKHEPIVPISNNGNGNGNGGGGNGGGGNGGGNGLPCNPDSIYFQQQILPFLVASCAKVGCHDAITHEDGVVITSYQNVMNTAGVTPFSLNNSDLWEVLNETDPDDKMPPQGETPLTQDQLNMIALWINQGAQNLVCDDGLGPCDSTNVSYTASILPIIQNKCVGCHTTSTSTNGFIQLSNYAGVQAIAQTGELMGTITHSPSYSAMPKNGPSLSTCEIGKIRNWISEGAQNN